MKAVEKKSDGFTKLREIDQKMTHENRYLAIFQSMGEPAFVVDSEMTILEVNRAFERYIQSLSKNILGRKCVHVLDHDGCGFCPLKEAMQKRTSFENHEVNINLKGKQRTVLLNGSYLDEFNGEVTGGIVILRDITERKQTEDQLRTLLNEKEILLREVYHRVKNNFQVVSSLINLQLDGIEDPKARNAFVDSRNRIRSMALVHEKLYQSQDLSQIDFSHYISSLVQDLIVSFGLEPQTIALKIDVQNVSMSVEQAIPCGLIVNELVSNSLKHAFPDFDKNAGEIKISLHEEEDGYVVLSVHDNGVGMPKSLDFQNTDSLGLFLVKILAVDQLQGMVELDMNSGTIFTIRFQRGSV